MIGVIADDLSGAAEIGAVGLRFGLRAEVLVKGPPSGRADLVCIDTDSRLCAPDEAARRAAAAARMLRRAGAKWIYKKVDSVLRGRVSVEISAIMRVLRLPRVLLHPANPSLGRTIVGGQYFVRGRLINKTEFARDPAYPRLTADVHGLLGRTPDCAVQVRAFNEHLPETGIIICESGSKNDVRRWAARADLKTLPAGGSEFFAALLPAFEKKSSRPRAAVKKIRHARAGELFICGTTSDSAKKFIRAAMNCGTPVFSLPGEVAWGADFTRAAARAISLQVDAALRSEPRVILQIGLRTVQEAAVARRLSAHLTQLAEAVLKRSKIDRVFVEGGATAVELVRRMGWLRLSVMREIAPGVATLALNGDAALQLTIKPGTYVWPDEVVNGAVRAEPKQP